jgi:hypothetical protein
MSSELPNIAVIIELLTEVRKLQIREILHFLQQTISLSARHGVRGATWV